MTTEAFITPSVLRWARERDGLSTEDAAERLNVKPERLEAWESGTARPTFRQAQAIAQHLSVPFGYLFLSDPPDETLPLPDLRTVADVPAGRASPELEDLLNDALVKQEWYREQQVDDGARPIAFVGRYSLRDDPDTIATDIRNTIHIEQVTRQRAHTRDEYLRLLVEHTEGAGVLVLRSGVVGNNTHRKLRVEEFRGFVISDELAPLIFINGQDARAAQVFTLAHELAHLWVGQSGISNEPPAELAEGDANAIERLCNRVASEVLLPSAEFLEAWDRAEGLDRAIDGLATRFKVSSAVVLRRAHELALVTWDEYWFHYNQLIKRRQPQRAGGEGGNFYLTLFARNSRTLTTSLVTALAEGRVLHRDAARLLNVKVATLDTILDHVLGTGRPPRA